MKHGHPQLRFLGAMDSVTGSRYLVALRARIKRELGWRVRVPEYLESISLEDPR
jgi:hypothetical protein